MSRPNLVTEPGWLGVFTRHHAHGAIPTRARVVKVREEPGDATPLGTLGTVLGSLDATVHPTNNPDGEPILHAYFVEWDNLPRVAVGVIDWKIKEVS